MWFPLNIIVEAVVPAVLGQERLWSIIQTQPGYNMNYVEIIEGLHKSAVIVRKPDSLHVYVLKCSTMQLVAVFDRHKACKPAVLSSPILFLFMLL